MDTSRVDLLAEINRDTILKRVASTNGGEYHGPCPFCGGKDRFIVQPDQPCGGRWSCRHCSPRWQDGIAYVQERDHVGFVDACRILRLDLEDRDFHRPSRRHIPPPTSVSAPRPMRRDYIALNDKGWQQAADAFCKSAYDLLWKDDHSDAHRYLRQRGLNDSVYQAAGIGFNPRTHHAQWGDVKVWLPAGIVIPWKIDGDIWRINIRRFAGEPKYIQPKGCAPGLYRADTISLGCTVLMVEGEFDALAILSHTCHLCKQHNLVPIAVGPATGARDQRWVADVALADRVLLAFDADDAGDDAALWWAGVLGQKVRRLRPTQHDVTDMWKAGQDLEAWLKGIPVCS